MHDHIVKAQACENTFILVDHLHLTQVHELNLDDIYQQLLMSTCDDAMILMDGREDQGSLTLKMLVFGVDKKFGDFCGNGSRAVAAYLFQRYTQYSRFYLDINGIRCELTNRGENIYSTLLPKINCVPQNKFINTMNVFVKQQEYYIYRYHHVKLVYLDMMEPHLVVKANMSEAAMSQMGQEINQHTRDFPNGINLTFYHPLNDGHIQAVTYERGVQRLTKSCGSGACCAAIHYLNNQDGKVQVANPGGVLEIINEGDQMRLTGKASISVND